MSPKRERSPNFPYEGIEECARLAEKMYRRMPINTLVDHSKAIELMGLSLASSTSRRIVSAMLSYRLFFDEGTRDDKRVALTQLAEQIINASDRIQLYRQAVLNDKMMHKVWDEWGSNLPKDEKLFASELESKFGFRNRSTARFLRVAKDNYAAAKLYEYSEAGGHKAAPQPELFESERIEPPPRVQGHEPNYKEYEIGLDGGRVGYLRVPSLITEEDIDYIANYLTWILRNQVKLGG